MKPLVSWILLSVPVVVVLGHVRLDFPEARSLPLDFLDNVRTPGPCGMPKAEAKTSIQAGTRINVTWHLAYPHQGRLVFKNFIIFLRNCFHFTSKSDANLVANLNGLGTFECIRIECGADIVADASTLGTSQFIGASGRWDITSESCF